MSEVAPELPKKVALESRPPTARPNTAGSSSLGKSIGSIPNHPKNRIFWARSVESQGKKNTTAYQIRSILCTIISVLFGLVLLCLAIYNVVFMVRGLPESENKGCNCGHKFQSSSDEEVSEWPWQVAMRINMTGIDFASSEDEVEKFCAASLIHEEWLITAADCVPYIGNVTKPEAISVSIGEYHKDMWNHTISAEQRGVDLIIVHGDYERDKHLHDMALLHLSSPVNDSKYIMPVCLPYKHMEQDFEGATVTVTGWGSLSFNKRESETVFSVEVPIITNHKCDVLHKDNAVTDDMFCSYEIGRDSCQGDSGGPLVWLSDKDRWQLIGVVTFGTFCGKSGSPGVYNKVTKYIDWIEQSTNATFCNPKK